MRPGRATVPGRCGSGTPSYSASSGGTPWPLDDWWSRCRKGTWVMQQKGNREGGHDTKKQKTVEGEVYLQKKHITQLEIQ